MSTSLLVDGLSDGEVRFDWTSGFGMSDIWSDLTDWLVVG